VSASVSLSRRRCLLLSFSLPLALGLSACATTTPEQSQDELIQRFYALIAAGDFDACIALISARNISRKQLASFEHKLRRMLAGAKGMIDSKGGLAKVEVVERTFPRKSRSSSSGCWSAIAMAAPAASASICSRKRASGKCSCDFSRGWQRPL
jgi:hypothetical protein